MDTYSRALLLAGFALLTVPLWAPVLDLTGSDYLYRSANVTVENGTTASGTIAVRGAGAWENTLPTERIACIEFEGEDRGCILERRLRNGSVPAPAAASDGLTLPKYAVFGSQGPVYRRTVGGTEDEPTIGLKRVPPERALANVTSGEPSQGVVRRAIRKESVRTAERIDLGEDESALYTHDGGYVVVYEAGRIDELVSKPAVERGLEAMAVLFGALLVFRAGKRVAGKSAD